MPIQRLTTILLLSISIMLFQACTSGFEAAHTGVHGESSSSSTGGTVITNWQSTELEQCTNSSEPPAATPTRRLTKREISNIMNQVFGSGLSGAVTSELNLLPLADTSERFDSVQNLVSQQHIDALFRVGEALAEALTDEYLNFMNIGTCAQSTSNACVSQLISDLGLRLFRRPITRQQQDRYEAFVQEFSAIYGRLEALGALVSAMIQAPEFYYVLEINGADQAAGIQALDQYEIATRISLAFTGAGPDDALFAAAASGALNQVTILSHANRLMESPLGRAHFNEFFAQNYHLREIPNLSYSEIFLNGQSLNGLEDQMVNEAMAYINHQAFTEEGTFYDLMTSNVSFVTTDELASIYGIEKSSRADGQVRFASPKRHGLMTRAALLVAPGEETNPFHRGNVVYSDYLCGLMVRPDPDLIPEAFAPPPKGLNFSNREILEGQTSKPDCIGCHQSINPFGFAFESFDNLGRFRTLEQHFDEDGNETASFPINSHTHPRVDRNIASISGLADLSRIFGRSADARTCFAKKWIRFSLGRYEHRRGDACAVNNMAIQLNEEGQGIKGMFSGLTQNPHFTLRVQPTE